LPARRVRFGRSGSIKKTALIKKAVPFSIYFSKLSRDHLPIVSTSAVAACSTIG
jgi:hypothetical protein